LGRIRSPSLYLRKGLFLERVGMMGGKGRREGIVKPHPIKKRGGITSFAREGEQEERSGIYNRMDLNL